MKHAIIHYYDAQPVTVAQVRDITTDKVWKWLAAGWKDIKSAPAISLSYGLGLTLLSYLIILTIIGNEMYFLLPQVIAGFFLVAPLLGIGLYDVSRQLERGKPPSLQNTLQVFRQNSFNIFNMGVVLVVALIAWVTLAHLIVAVTFSGITPATWQGFISSLFGTWEGAQLLMVGVASGAVIAFLIFSISTIAVPMLFDRKANVFDAIQTSWNTVRFNFVPMLLWSIVLLGIITAGFLTLFVALVFGFPLAAHATWHAYRDLVEK